MPSAASFTPFGVADQTSTGSTANIGNIGLPYLGQVIEVTLSGGVPGGNATLVLGSSNTQSQYGPLPLNLGFIGIPGSHLYTSVNIEMPASVDGFGNASMPMLVPNDPNLAGRSFYLQWQVFDAGSPAGFIMSDAAEAVVN